MLTKNRFPDLESDDGQEEEIPPNADATRAAQMQPPPPPSYPPPDDNHAVQQTIAPPVYQPPPHAQVLGQTAWSRLPPPASGAVLTAKAMPAAIDGLTKTVSKAAPETDSRLHDDRFDEFDKSKQPFFGASEVFDVKGETAGARRTKVINGSAGLVPGVTKPTKQWQKYHDVAEDQSLIWWWCEVDGIDCFLEAHPGKWCKYADPTSEKCYWWLSDDSWFWVESGSTSI